jgi:hypothetical protein
MWIFFGAVSFSPIGKQNCLCKSDFARLSTDANCLDLPVDGPVPPVLSLETKIPSRIILYANSVAATTTKSIAKRQKRWGYNRI